jgi:hypothetical protein
VKSEVLEFIISTASNSLVKICIELANPFWIGSLLPYTFLLSLLQETLCRPCFVVQRRLEVGDRRELLKKDKQCTMNTGVLWGTPHEKFSSY